MSTDITEWAKEWFRGLAAAASGDLDAPRPQSHARLGFSKADIWMNCSGAPNAQEGLPDVVTPYAREGTAAHAVAATCLVEKREAIEFLDREIDLWDYGPKISVDEQMVDGIDLYLNLVNEECEYGFNPDIVLEVEHRGSLERLDPEFFALEPIFGTCDARVFKRHQKRLTIIDLKYGYRYVSVKKPQTRGYAVMEMLSDELLNEEIAEVELIIVQPRSPAYDGPPVRRQVMTVDEIMKWANDEMLPAAKATRDPNAPRTAGEHCLFCLASPHCETNRRWAFEAAMVQFNEPDVMPNDVQFPPEPQTISVNDLARILNVFPNVEAWMKSVRQYAFGLANAGVTVATDDGSLKWKLIEKRGRRKWAAEDPLDTQLALCFDLGMEEDEIYARKLKSPAQVELAMKERFGRKWRTVASQMSKKGLTITPAAGVTLVPENEQNADRPAVTGQDIAMFEPLDGDDR